MGCTVHGINGMIYNNNWLVMNIINNDQLPKWIKQVKTIFIFKI